MEREGRGQIVWGLQHLPIRGQLQSPLIILFQKRPVIRVSQRNHLRHPLPRCQTAQVSVTVFGNDHLDVLLRMVHVRHERHNGRNVAALGERRGDERRNVAGTSEVGKMAATVKQDGDAMGKAIVEITLNVAAGKDPLDGTDYQFDDSGVAVRIPYVPFDIESVGK